MTDIPNQRLIDGWFPIAAIDEACGTPAGSGRVEKAIFTWFASRPIAQARAAALTSLLPPNDSYKPLVEEAVLRGHANLMAQLAAAVVEHYAGTPPVVLDMFSGRGIIPLEAGRAGANAIGVDLSPVATLAGRLLADYPARDWSGEPAFPLDQDGRPNDASLPGMGAGSSPSRLADDVERFLAAVGARVVQRMAPYYPRNTWGHFPWGYLWAITMPCDGCKRRFPLVGSLLLRHPYRKSGDPGQSLKLGTERDRWTVEVIDGSPQQPPTYAAAEKADGKKHKGKTARCLFCKHIHPLETVKAKGELGQYEDVLLIVADVDPNGRRFFRLPNGHELSAAHAALEIHVDWPYSAVPDEMIPPGNVHTIMASGYGYRRFGDLMNARQTRLFIETVLAIQVVHRQLLRGGFSDQYARALASYAAATMCRQIRYSTRGARLRAHGSADGKTNNNLQVDHIFINECNLNFQVDYFETSPGLGAGTWLSVGETTISALRKVLREMRGMPARFRAASATALPMRDASVDVVITDPPYYDMIEYADGSDLFHVWLKRTLHDIEPELFGPDAQLADGLQDKNDEIIVRRVHEPGRVRHDTEFYESMLAKSFNEARRVLKPDGHLVVVFGHSDPEAWRRLLGALQAAGFVVTSAWPSRTESANSGVASIKVTVTIGCRVGLPGRPVGTAAQVDREASLIVAERVRQWDADGLALEDQLMASYGPAMEVYGRYSRVLDPDGTNAELDRYLNVARRAVRDAMKLKVDELPIETFDAITRFSLFWLRAKGRAEVPKGEAVFFVQADHLRLADLRDQILTESKSGFRLRLDDPGPAHREMSTFEVVRAMAQAWQMGGAESVAEVLAAAGREPSDRHLWAVVSDLASHLPAADDVAKALAGIRRTSGTIGTLVGNVRTRAEQTSMDDLLVREPR